MRDVLKFVLIVCLSVVAAPSALRAQPLADRAPADAYFYFGWKGTETSGTGLDGSRVQAVMKAAHYDQMIADLLPQLAERFGKDQPDLFDNIQKVQDLLDPLKRHPTAVYLKASGVASDPFHLVVICQAGAESKTLAQRVRDLIEQTKEDNLKKEVHVVDTPDSVTIVMGPDIGGKLPEIGASLKSDPSFSAAAKQTIADPFFVIHVNVDRIMKMVGQQIGKENEDFAKKFASALDASGLNGLHRMTFAGGFEGKDWATARFIDAPAPRKGLLAVVDGKPIDAGVLKSIPSSAAVAQVMRFDAGAFVKELRNVAGAVDAGKGAQTFDQGIGAAQMMLGCNPITDILEPLGDTWVMYSDEHVAGNATAGIVIVNKLDDPAKAKRGLNALWLAVSNMANGRMGNGMVSFKQEMSGDLRISSVTTPGLSPAWTIQDDRLLIAFSTEALLKLASAPTPTSGLDRNDHFGALAKRLAGNAPITSLRFDDLPKTAPEAYDKYAQAYGMIKQLIEQEGVQLPDSILPPKDALMANLAPAADVTWSDAAGFHGRAISPFPGADLFSNAPNSVTAEVGGAALGAGIMLPSLNRARETANRIKCASNERQIGQAILLWSNDHQGNYPPDLGSLLEEDIAPDAFVCPSGDTSLPKTWKDMTKPRQAEWVNAKSDYDYIGKGLNNHATGDQMVLYEKPNHHGRDGMNILYGDGHVDFVLMPQATKAIEELKTRRP